jgi:non-heme chloroperoxidase
VLDRLPPDVRAIAPTLRGHGDADRPADGYDPAGLAADLAGVLGAAGLSAAVVAGHSSGALVALRFALDFPDRTLGLVLVGAFATLPRAVVAEVDPILSRLEDPIDEAFIRAFQAGAMARPAPPGLLDALVAESRKVPARVWRATWAGVRDADLTAELPRMTAPTVVVWGDLDHLCDRASQDALLAAIPDARLAVCAGCGHAPHWEDPARVAAELVALARRAGGRGR